MEVDICRANRLGEKKGFEELLIDQGFGDYAGSGTGRYQPVWERTAPGFPRAFLSAWILVVKPPLARPMARFRAALLRRCDALSSLATSKRVGKVRSFRQVQKFDMFVPRLCSGDTGRNKDRSLRNLERRRGMHQARII